MSELAVFLFGRFCVRSGDELLRGFEARKAQELLCFLVLNRGRPQPRETLAGLLWGDCTTSQSRKYLRQALWQLQTALASESRSPDGPVLLVQPSWITLDIRASIWVDVAAFEEASAVVHGIRGRDMHAEMARTMESALPLYRGDLLEGWYQDWCLYERERLQNLYLAMLDKLMDYHEVRGEWETALDYGSRVLRYDRAREHTHRKMMRLHAMAGDRTGALRQYQRCVSALDEELGVGPSRQTAALFNQIRADRLDIPLALDTEVISLMASGNSSQAEELKDLRQLRRVLGDLRQQIEQGLRIIEQTLGSQD